jgi:hypothetical protein
VEDHVGEPGLAVGSGDEEASWFLPKDTPSEAWCPSEKPLRGCGWRTGLGAEKTSPEPEDGPDEGQGLEIELGGRLIQQGSWGPDPELKALSGITGRDEGIERAGHRVGRGKGRGRPLNARASPAGRGHVQEP